MSDTPPSTEACPTCGGDGTMRYWDGGYGRYVKYGDGPCPACNGRGTRPPVGRTAIRRAADVIYRVHPLSHWGAVQIANALATEGLLVDADTERLLQEVEQLRQWKREALTVLASWDQVAEGVPMRLGEFKSEAVARYIADIARWTP